jgi:hypothetical protein
LLFDSGGLKLGIAFLELVNPRFKGVEAIQYGITRLILRHRRSCAERQ